MVAKTLKGQKFYDVSYVATIFTVESDLKA